MISAVRQAQVSVDHVFAELLAFPLASEAAFETAGFGLDPAPRGWLISKLWPRFEREVLRGLPSVTLDEAASMRDRVWFDQPGAGPQLLHHYLARHASGLLVANGPVAIPRPSDPIAGPADYFPIDAELDEGAVAARRRWRWVSFALPPDLLLAALPSEPPARVETLTPAVRAMLADRGYAETHVHIGACLSFPELWVDTQYALADPACTQDRMASLGAAFEDGKCFAGWLLRAALARCALAGALADIAGRPLAVLVDEWSDRLGREFRVEGYARAFRVGLVELATGRLQPDSPPWEDIHRVYRDLYSRLASEGASQGRLDPVAFLLGWADGERIYPETELIRGGLRRLAQSPADTDFERLFWQCVRVRNLFYRHVTQRPMTPGLHWFLRFFDRIKHGRRFFSETGQRTGAAFRLHGPGAGLRSLELRTGPENGWDAMRKELTAAAAGVPAWVGCQAVDAYLSRENVAVPARTATEAVEFGIVLHFVKARGDGTAKGTPSVYGVGTAADPAANSTGYRYAKFAEGLAIQATAWADLLERRPHAVRLLRGVDACNDERGVPNWVFVRPFSRVTKAGAAAAHHEQTPVPRRTIHVGEDFVHLLSGLRAVAEAVRYFGLRAGDRLGHALALGVDPIDWANRAGRVVLRREERLFDLAWEWHWCTRRSRTAIDRLPFVEQQIRRLVEEMFRGVIDRPLGPSDVCDLIDDLHNPDCLEAVGFPQNLTTAHLDRRAGLLRAFLGSHEVFRAGQVAEWIVTRDEGPVIAALQAEVRRQVGRRGVVVEVNPSSNLLIGDFGDLTRHPFWRLASPPGVTPDVPPVLVSLGSDDPITFATDLRQEYQLVYDAVVASGCSAAETLGWLDRIRADGMSARFTLSTSGT